MAIILEEKHGEFDRRRGKVTPWVEIGGIQPQAKKLLKTLGIGSGKGK